MAKIYLDNAATTPIAPEVLDTMLPYFREFYGNPSSTHVFGRQVRNAIELSRRNIAKHLNCHPSEIIFTSGGTEADNIALRCAVRDLGVKNIITTQIEHHAVLHTVDHLVKSDNIHVHYVNLKKNGHVDLNHLEELLKSNEDVLVSLMHGNNEVGNLLPLKKVGEMCKQYNAYFHSDTVQTMGHYRFDLKELGVDFLACAAHKFHGPKGVGFLFKRSGIKTSPMIEGGAQERGIRGGTENIYGIVGLSKAFDLAYEELEEHQKSIQEIKTYMIKRLREEIDEIRFNGDFEGESLYTVLNVKFPSCDIDSQILFRLDIEGIACSGGSACSSGSKKGSHVLSNVGLDGLGPSIRFSFSRYNTKEDIDVCIKALKDICTFGMEVENEEMNKQ
ncbi:MAG: cysteine desulfurase family protein [Bacteroidota bacterium]